MSSIRDDLFACAYALEKCEKFEEASLLYYRGLITSRIFYIPTAKIFKEALFSCKNLNIEKAISIGKLISLLEKCNDEDLINFLNGHAIDIEKKSFLNEEGLSGMMVDAGKLNIIDKDMRYV